eukprot:1161696-Pelagomonas_calceolata.AAC.16
MLTARVHPGESNSSWMVRGLIEYLTGSSAEACMLRKHFVFKIVPMLNPDGASGGYGILSARGVVVGNYRCNLAVSGIPLSPAGVVVGNYRCNLAGFDLNRTWADASRKLHPTIFACKAMLKQFLEERQRLAEYERDALSLLSESIRGTSCLRILKNKSITSHAFGHSLGCMEGYLVFGLPWVLPEVQRISTTSQRLSDISSIVLVGRPVFRLPWALPEAQHLLVRLWQGEPTKEDLQQHVVCSV